MNEKKLLSARLTNQQITARRFDNAGELVQWMGAIQAQDYLGSLWAIGMRNGLTEQQVEEAIINKEIVRSWPMRGTLHFVPPADLRWMLKLLTPRVVAKAATYYRQSNLDQTIFRKAEKVLSKAMAGVQLTRAGVYQILEKAKITVDEQRGLHIIGFLAQQGLICFGPRNKKQQTFVLLDEWIPHVPSISADNGLKILAQRYFTSHGPATLQDFVWWTGLTVKEARHAIEMTRLQEIELNGTSYFHSGNPTGEPDGLFLLPSYDEYLVAYKDRSITIDKKYAAQLDRGAGGIFTSTIINNGKIIGIWKRTAVAGKVKLEQRLFCKPTIKQTRLLLKANKRYAEFTGLELLAD